MKIRCIKSIEYIIFDTENLKYFNKILEIFRPGGY